MKNISINKSYRKSIPNVRNIELQPDKTYLITYYTRDMPIEQTVEHGIVDSIFHDGGRHTTFTVTFKQK